ncbi:MAG TPA: glutamate--tRNA ligase family protein [Gemmatimonadales bacterium]|jgi:glutamyl-tRNA synthetase/glutamyl-Q tRNA(Asp) synthetase|nr:glutamate--tRNA ligase family protein [Gemmatimonadales bacterium]
MRTRFAPAPTGYLHLGHVANALYVWGATLSRGAEVLFRVEDHDRQRCRAVYEQALLEDLDWLGLVPDLGTTAEFRSGPSPFRQSDNSEVYAAHVELLRTYGHHVYACDCSRSTQGGAAVPEGGVTRPYDGRCRSRNLAPGPGRGLRVVIEAGDEVFEDLRLGPQVQSPAEQCGDLLLRDRLGNWTYQFAVVVDDLRQAIDLVIRGEDLLDSTGRQLRLARMLGRRKMPLFLHHPLIRKPSGEKLSKASRDTSVRALRAAGKSPEDLFGQALFALGLLPLARPVTLDEARGLVPTS